MADIGYKLPWESPMTYAPSKSRGQTLAAKTNKSLSESPDLDARKTMLLCKSQRLILPKQDLLPSLGYFWTGCIRKFCRHMLAHFVLYIYIYFFMILNWTGHMRVLSTQHFLKVKNIIFLGDDYFTTFSTMQSHKT